MIRRRLSTKQRTSTVVERNVAKLTPSPTQRRILNELWDSWPCNKRYSGRQRIALFALKHANLIRLVITRNEFQRRNDWDVWLSDKARERMSRVLRVPR